MRTALLLLLVVLTACSTAHVVGVDQATGVNFTAYHTYSFLDSTARNEQGYQVMSPQLNVLKAAVAEQLARRGYQPAATPSQADLWVNIGRTVESKVQTRETYLRDAPVYTGQRRYSWQSQNVPVRQYEEGTTTIDIVDAARKQLIWQGAVASPVSNKHNEQNKTLAAAIATLFGRYPVPAH